MIGAPDPPRPRSLIVQSDRRQPRARAQVSAVMHGNALFDLARWRRAEQDLLSLAIPGEFAAKFSGLELYRLVASIVRLICGRSLRLSAGDSML